ncbi:TauD/TfdA family dioxygenase [Micromonospora sp. WMMD967]|uniref:TauD/TfdA family dioxygenase n=1 Tax=Micromonospora sp. WMMD967 TaxID=3016101 RepID=UPI002417E2D6|nr:TauD/TfdA family dioxygenase [Micromonospora sp. WMMD967]MDG4839847.1 TauD/TfdA family dioxygenase [Micromonospora sp. WMMD967]
MSSLPSSNDRLGRTMSRGRSLRRPSISMILRTDGAQAGRMRLLEAGRETEVSPDLVPGALAHDGVVLIRQGSIAEVRALLDRWTVPVDHPHQVAEGLTVIAPRIRTDEQDNEAGFTDLALSPHTDRSLHARPPSVLATLMLTPARAGGSATLVDGAQVLALVRQCAEDSEIAGLRLRTATGRPGPAVVEIGGSHARIRYRDDRIAGPYSTDGRTDVVVAIRRLIAETAQTLHLDAGDGYLVHNHRFLHGRTAFTGDRSLVRFLARVTSDHPYAWLNRGFSIASS